MVITTYHYNYNDVVRRSDLGFPTNPIVNSSAPDYEYTARDEESYVSDRIGIIRSHLSI